MIKNYLKIAWRNLLRNKSFSLINILGLSIGISTCLLIFFYVNYELSYDSFHSKKERVVRISGGFKTPDGDFNLAASPTLLVDELKRSYPEIETGARLKNVSPVVKLGEQLSREDNFYDTEREIFNVLDFSFKQGSAIDCLARPRSIVLTERTAQKYFGKESPVGQTMTIDGKAWSVTAVIFDPPGNSDIKIDALRSAEFNKATNWTLDDFDVYSFVLFKGKPALSAFSAKLADISVRLIQPELDKQGANAYHVQFIVLPLKDVHYTKGLLDDAPKGNKQVSYLFSLLAVFVLVIAILNYINLSTARATERAKEVGVRKVNGAKPFQLIRQFLMESTLLILFSWIIAFIVSLILLPLFNSILETQISFSVSKHLGFMAIAFLSTLLLAGLYPAFVLSRFKPVEILKGKWRYSNKGVFLRKSLSVVQFVLTAALITSTIVIHSQMRYISKRDLGFSSKQMLDIKIENDSIIQRNVKPFVNALTSIYGRSQVTAGNGMKGEGMSLGTTFAETEQGTKRELMSAYQFVDKNFIPLYGIVIKEGRNFSDSFSTDKDEAFLVNEAYVNNMRWKKPIGKSLEGYGRKAKVIGVVKNYYYQSLREMVRPTIIAYNTRFVSAVGIKTEASNLPQITAEWKKFFPNHPIEYEFLDEAYASQYKKDRTTQTLFTFFTLLAIFVSMMGLYGLVSLMAIQKSKEISVRKILGASLSQLLALLSRGFVKLIIIASVLAVPMSWYAMNKWLQDYAYHISLSWWMFSIPVLLIIFIALLVISQQILKAALENPVKSLRSE